MMGDAIVPADLLSMFEGFENTSGKAIKKGLRYWPDHFDGDKYVIPYSLFMEGSRPYTEDHAKQFRDWFDDLEKDLGCIK